MKRIISNALSPRLLPGSLFPGAVGRSPCWKAGWGAHLQLEAAAAYVPWLERYHWPGNVRERQNMIERAAVLAKGPLIEVDGVPGQITDEPTTCSSRTLKEVQRAHIQKILQERDWVIEGERGAANALGLEPSTLRYRMRKLGIKRPGGGDPGNRASWIVTFVGGHTGVARYMGGRRGR